MSTSGGAVGGVVKTVFTPRAVQVGGDITLHNGAAMADVAAAVGGPGAGGLDVVIGAAIGDVLLISGTLNPVGAAVITFMDVVTVVLGAVVNYVGQSGGAGAGAAAGLWQAATGLEYTAGAASPYAVQAGDIDAGNVRLRLLYSQNSAVTTRTLGRSVGNGPFILSVSNLGH